jgi:hypothetical protein
MKIGFENEYFVQDKDGTYLSQVPYDLPHDAAGTLVEVRSEPADDPTLVLTSFKSRYAELERAIINKGYTLANLAVCDTVFFAGHKETAGFHIHFSNPKWDRTQWPPNHYGREADWHDNPPKEIAAMMEQLDGVFKKYYDGIPRHPHTWRPKTWGWEYRRLPATVEPGIVAKRLTELYYPAALKVAPRKKVA